MDATGTGCQLWQLTAGNNNNPALTALTPTKWDFNDLPDRSPTGPLAYYLPGVRLTISGQYNAVAETGAFIPRDVLPGLIIQSIDWVNAWHGTPISANHVLGQHLPVVEFVGNGFRNGQRQQNALHLSTEFSFTVFIPACSRLGKLSKETAQLALLYQSSNLKVNVQALSGVGSPVATYTGEAASFSGLSAKLTAVLQPRQELVMGTPVEWILHQVVAGANSPAVKVTGFGRDTMLTGVEPKGGVMFLAEYTGKNRAGGVMNADTITQFAFPWRGQQQIDDIKAWVEMNMDSLPNDRPQLTQGAAMGAATTVNDFSTFPYTYDNAEGGADLIDLTSLWFFPLVTGGNDLRLTDLQTAENDQTYFLTSSTPFATGDHLIPAKYARVWTSAKRADWVSQVRKSGLDTYVLGSDAAGADLYRRYPRDKHVLTADQETYLAWQYVRKPVVQVAR